MSIKVSGMNKLISELEKKYGSGNIQVVTDKALKAGGEVFIKALKSEFEGFKDTGASIEEVELHGPETIAGVRTLTVRWRGPKGRYRIIHLNEFGTIHHPRPQGKGAIARAIENSHKAYRKALKDAIQRGL